MTLMKKSSGFSILGISVAGGVSHNIGQLMVAALIVENTSLLYYAPVLLISGVITGLLIGILTKEVTKKNSSLSHFPYIVQYFISVPYRYPSSAQNALPFLL